MRQFFHSEHNKTVGVRGFPVILSAVVCMTLIAYFVSCNDDTIQPPSTLDDTTSHDFTQETFVLGTLGSSFLDVAIVNDTLAYAVGEIYMIDSTGVYNPPYGVAIWNGKTWRLTRIFAWYGNNKFSIRPTGIFTLSAGDIWFARGDVFQWDGKSEFLKAYYIAQSPTNPDGILGLNQFAEKVWGSSRSNIYAVGYGGCVAHFNGASWRRLNSGTKVAIQDVWGAYDEKTKEHVALCAATDPYERTERRVLRILPTGSVDSIPWRSDRRVSSIWFSSIEKIFTTGGGVFIRNKDQQWIEQTSVPLVYTRRVRGVANNDVFVSGDFGLIAHFNGKSWESWLTDGAFYSCDYKGDLFMAVGSTADQRGVITILRRQK